MGIKALSASVISSVTAAAAGTGVVGGGGSSLKTAVMPIHRKMSRKRMSRTTKIQRGRGAMGVGAWEGRSTSSETGVEGSLEAESAGWASVVEPVDEFAGRAGVAEVVLPAPGIWVLEIQIAHPTRPFGAFYEDILMVD